MYEEHNRWHLIAHLDWKGFSFWLEETWLLFTSSPCGKSLPKAVKSSFFSMRAFAVHRTPSVYLEILWKQEASVPHPGRGFFHWMLQCSVTRRDWTRHPSASHLLGKQQQVVTKGPVGLMPMTQTLAGEEAVTVTLLWAKVQDGSKHLSVTATT